MLEIKFVLVQSLSHVQLFVTPRTAAHQASLSFTVSQSLFKLMSIKSVKPSNHLILCHPLLLLPSIFPSIRVFSSESTLHIRWPKYWSFSFIRSPSNEYARLISFRIHWFDFLAVQGTLKSHLQHHNLKASVLHCSAFFMVQLSHLYMTTGKPQHWLKGPLLAKWCLCFLICCLGWSYLFFQGESIFYFHGCSHHPQWFWSPRKIKLSLFPLFTYLEEDLKSLLMRVEEESEIAILKTNIQKTKIMVSGPITSWQIDRATVETVADFIWGGSKITADGDCSHELKRHLLLGRKAMTSLESILKSRDITLPTEVHHMKAMAFPVVMYGCESWTIKKDEHWRMMLLNCSVGEDSWESLGLQGDPTSPS